MTKTTLIAPADLDFGLVRPGSKREALLSGFTAKRNQSITTGDLLTLIYGTQDAAYRGALYALIDGLISVIDARFLPVKIVKSRVDKELQFGLYDA